MDFDHSINQKPKYMVLVFFCVFFIQFNVPFKIISLIETSQWIGGAKRDNPGKTD